MGTPLREKAWTWPHRLAEVVLALTRMRTWAVLRPTTPTRGGRSFSKVPRPCRLLARRRGGSSTSGCGVPFFPRILEHLITFDFRIQQSAPGLQGFGLALKLVTQFQHRLIADAEFPGRG